MAKTLLLLTLMLALPVAAQETVSGKVITFDVASGGVLGSLVTAVIMWLNGQRKQRTQISPDPLNVKGVAPSIKEPTCAATHKAVDEHLSRNKADHESIFPRLTSLEGRVSALEGCLAEIRIVNKSIDDKLTILLRRK